MNKESSNTMLKSRAGKEARAHCVCQYLKRKFVHQSLSEDNQNILTINQQKVILTNCLIGLRKFGINVIL